MSINLKDHQLKAIDQMKTGSILCGGVGSGKSRTAIAYYLLKECQGSVKINGKGSFSPMQHPKDLYIITTAKKRDSLEWEKELANFVLSQNEDCMGNTFGVSVSIDSWNNIQKYKNVFGAFFIFDEQRVVGSGVWVRTFLNIARKNHWILLSATPGDEWKDYVPVFVANGFFRNKSDFSNKHCVWSRSTRYPKIERYYDTHILEEYRNQILVPMEYEKRTVRHFINYIADYDRVLYRKVFRERWDPYNQEPIQEMGKFIYLLRQVANSNKDRIWFVREILRKKHRCIIFYNFQYELKMLIDFLDDFGIEYRQWNGKKHEEIPTSNEWAYLVQYSAGCEGWNCVTTDTIIFYSQTYSYRMLEQACGRIDRMNTPYIDLYYYYIRSTSSIDLAIYSKIKNKKSFNESAFIKKYQKTEE